MTRVNELDCSGAACHTGASVQPRPQLKRAHTDFGTLAMQPRAAQVCAITISTTVK